MSSRDVNMTSASLPKQKITRENWFEEHPRYLEIQSYGYGDRACLRSTMLVYLDLIEVKHWFDVEFHRCDDLERVFITGRPLKRCHRELVVPIASLNSLSHKDIHHVIVGVCKAFKNSGLCEMSSEENTKTVHFAVTESNSTTVYYKMTDGLVPPEEVGDDDPDADLKIRWKKKSKITCKNR